MVDEKGGRADVFVDGMKSHPIDAYANGVTHDNVLWHTYGLRPRPHTIRIVARPDADARSKARKIVIAEAVIYRNRE